MYLTFSGLKHPKLLQRRGYCMYLTFSGLKHPVLYEWLRPHVKAVQTALVK